MPLTDEFEKLKNIDCPEIKQIIQAFINQPEVRLYVSLGKMVDKLVKEMDKIFDKQSTSILEGEDKLFERVNTLVVKYSEYDDAFKKGRAAIGGVHVEEDKGSNPLFRKNGRNIPKEEV